MEKFRRLIESSKPFKSKNLVRIGSEYDGGYVLPKDAVLNADCLISFGVSTNFDFEQDFLKKNSNCKILMFDPFIGPFNDFRRLTKRIIKKQNDELNVFQERNPEYIPEKSNLFIQISERITHWFKFYRFIRNTQVTFKKIGLREYSDRLFIKFSELFKIDELKTKKSIVLKIDIEGDEYRVYKQALHHLDNVTTILLEVHEVEIYYETLVDLISKLKINKFFLTHIHGNNSDKLIKGVSIPNTLELVFNRYDYCLPDQVSESKYPLPDLDRPCNPNYIDYKLDWL